MIPFHPSRQVPELYSPCNEGMTAYFYNIFSIIRCNSGEGGGRTDNSDPRVILNVTLRCATNKKL